MLFISFTTVSVANDEFRYSKLHNKEFRVECVDKYQNHTFVYLRKYPDAFGHSIGPKAKFSSDNISKYKLLNIKVNKFHYGEVAGLAVLFSHHVSRDNGVYYYHKLSLYGDTNSGTIETDVFKGKEKELDSVSIKSIFSCSVVRL